MESGKISTVRDWPMPTTVKEVRAFIGFANFYRMFIRNLGQNCQATTRAHQERRGFLLRPEKENAFQCLKKAIVSEPVLKLQTGRDPLRLRPRCLASL